jgi:hypothetical protein
MTAEIASPESNIVESTITGLTISITGDDIISPTIRIAIPNRNAATNNLVVSLLRRQRIFNLNTLNGNPK